VDLIGQLPDAMSAAKDALRDEEGEITEDFGSFLSDLETELERRQAFADDIAVLRSLELDDLADTFTAEGLDAAGALADAVANPEEARRAEALLDEFAVSQAESFRSSFEDELQQVMDLTIPINLTLAIQALQAIGLGGITGQLEQGQRLQGLEPAAINTTVNINTPSISTTDAQRAGQAVNGVIANGPR
jgi:hypothetical protein